MHLPTQRQTKLPQKIANLSPSKQQLKPDGFKSKGDISSC